MKKINLLIFSILMLFSFYVSADALTTGSNGVTLPNPKPSGGSGNWPNQITGAWAGGVENELFGFRMSFVNSGYATIVSYDYYDEGANGKYAISTSRYSKVFSAKSATNPGYSKVTYINNSSLRDSISYKNIDVNGTLNSNWYSYNVGSGLDGVLYNSPYNLANTLKKYNFKYDYNWREIGQNLESIKDMFSIEKYQGKKSNYEDDLIGLLKELGVPNSYLNADDIERLYVVFESTVAVRLYGQLYYGTAYELARFASGLPSNYDLGYPEASPGCQAGTDALCDVSSAVKRRYQCSGILTESYLGLQLVGVTTCKTFGDSTVTGNYGVGTTIVWFKDYLNPLNCDKIQKITNDYTKYMCTNVVDINKLVLKFNEKKPEEYKKITIDDYIKYCGCSSGTDNKCDPFVEVNKCTGVDVPAAQYQDGADRFDEDSYWENCVYNDDSDYSSYTINPHKYSNKNQSLTYYEESLGDEEFCPVYCIEKIQGSYDYNIPEVNSGFHFIYPSQSLTEVSGTRICSVKKRIINGKTVYVDFESYIKQLRDLNQQIQDAYLEYLFEEDKADKIENKHKITSSENCDYKYYSSHGLPHCTSDKPEYYDCNCVTNEETGIQTCQTCTRYVCTNNNYTRYDYYYTDSIYVTIDSSEHPWDYKSSGSITWCSSEVTPTANPSLTKYNRLVNEAKILVSRMQSCYDWLPDSIYNLDAEATLIYNDGLNYSIEKDLDRYVEKDEVTKDPEQYDCKDNNQTYILECTGTKRVICSVVKNNYNGVDIKVDKCNQVKIKRETIYSYYLPDGIYDYVTKDTNQSFHSSESISSLYGYNDYIDIGHSNLPVSYGAVNGAGTLKIEYGKLGHFTPEYDENKTMVDYILGNYEETKEDYGTWACGFSVYDQLIDDKKINVIFRPIDLSNPFPDITSSGRVTGSNWCYNGYCGTDSTNLVVTNVITNKKDVYSKEPMYAFDLTPSTIMKIRTYNKQQIQLGEGYADFKLDCEDETGNACISDFVSDLIIGDYGNVNTRGKCTNSAYRVTNSKVFYECQK